MPKVVSSKLPHEKAQTIGRWAETLFRALNKRVAKRWVFVSFRGKKGGEARGIVDVLAIRKDFTQPQQSSLKQGDLFDIVLVQVKRGSARPPTDEVVPYRVPSGASATLPQGHAPSSGSPAPPSKL
jgi:hypothetical protein